MEPYIARYRTPALHRLQCGDPALAASISFYAAACACTTPMLLRVALLLAAAGAHASGAGSALSSGLLARTDEEFAAADAGAASSASRLRRGSTKRPEAGGGRRTRRSLAGKAVFPAVLSGFLLAFGFFWDDGEADLCGKVAQRMELFAPPAVSAPGKASTKEQSGIPIEKNEPCGATFPILCLDFVRPCSSTQLAVSPVSFGAPEGWSTDVLGFMGVPVLTASCRSSCAGTAAGSRAGSRLLELRRRGGGREEDDLPLITVNAGQVSSAGQNIGKLTTSGTGQQVFEDTRGQIISFAELSASDTVLTLSSAAESPQIQATASWRAASAVLPTEHLEVSAQPGVDAALALACVLAKLDGAAAGC